ncbi:MAG: DUF4838 domain-containing protein [Clostridia bacterium]|nr:DUF4838 domain-containing protein [Clostridia bacterium]
MTKKMIKLCSVALAFVTLFTVSGCKDNDGDDTQSSTKEVEVLEKSGYKLVSDGISEYRILIAENALKNELVAAQELQIFLYESTGATLPILYGDDVAENSPIISIGQTERAAAASLNVDNLELNRSGYLMKTVGNSLYIIADEQFAGLGCVYGVYDLLEDCIDYRFYYTDEIHYAEKKNVELYKYDDVVTPTFDFRSTWYPALSDEDYRRRLRYFLFNEEYGWKAHTQTGVIVNKETYLAEHAFGMTKTVQNADGSTTEVPNHWFSNNAAQQLCWTAGEEMEYVAASDLYNNIKNNPDKLYFQIGQADNTGFCTCERCEQAKAEWGMNDAGLQINFANNVAKIINEWVARDYPEGRDVRIVLFAYMGTNIPPVVKNADGKWVAFSEKVKPIYNIYFEYAPIFANYSYPLEDVSNEETYNDLLKWNDFLGEKGKLMLWTYETNFHHFLYQFNNFATFREQLATYAENNVDYIFSQGASQTNQPCFQEMRLFVESQLMWDINKNYSELVQEFLNAFYKDAAPEMLEYYNLIKMRYEQAEVLLGHEFSTIYSDIGSKQIWTTGVVDGISGIFERAYAKIEHYKTEDPATYTKLYERIKEIELTLIYTKLSYYRGDYAQETINQMVDDFNYYTSKFGIIYVKENGASLQGMFDDYKK